MSAVTINIQPDLDNKVSEWRQDHDFQIPALVGADPDRLEQAYGVTGAPETFLLDRSGKILFRHIGFSPGEERVLEAQIRVLLDLEPFPVPTPGQAGRSTG